MINLILLRILKTVNSKSPSLQTTKKPRCVNREVVCLLIRFVLQREHHLMHLPIVGQFHIRAAILRGYLR
ncbi:MAG: hypothetical protein JWN30_2300 [Bacilli bacterium]|nr:hypothetical protein [Bacilli bacterium]